MKRRGWKFAVGLAACLMPMRAAAQSTCSRSAVSKLDSGLYTFQMNENDSSREECASIQEAGSGGVGFTITTADFRNATNGPAAAYTSIYRGCHWGACTDDNLFPIEESNLASAAASVSLTQPAGYNNDAAYDIWFNQTSKTSGQPNGTEVMIWLNHQGAIQPFGSRVAAATVDGDQYEVWTGKQKSWKIVSYVATAPVDSATNLDLMPFFEDAVARGSLDPSSWLIDVEFGFEIWTGGRGLAISDFSVSAAARPGSSAVSSAASGGPGGR
jgi:hypothetical protein